MLSFVHKVSLEDQASARGAAATVLENCLSNIVERAVPPDDESPWEFTEEIGLKIEALFQQQEEMESEPVVSKLAALVQEHPWMEPELVERELATIARENASARSKRRKFIAISIRMTAALAPHVACKPGCSHCCHMNTMIYEHEAIRLADVTGRKMVRLPYRPRDVVVMVGDQFNRKPCTFLVENKCSVYEDRPLVCRTHHSLRDTSNACSMDIPAAQHLRPPMYDPDILEVPYMELNERYNPFEPWGNIAEFFPI